MNLKTAASQIVERTAPSPTGDLHLGHVFSAITAYTNAKNNQGLFKLRIEDIDRTRCKVKFENEIISNLTWLGITWDEEVMRQRHRTKFYLAAIGQLLKERLLYPCSCTRKEINSAVLAPHAYEGTPPIYPGTCRNRQPSGPIKALRLDIYKALKLLSGRKLSFFETGYNERNFLEEQVISKNELESTFGDLVIARKDIGTSYNLSVVIDDAAQQITHVTRGDDLFKVTPIQILLQKLLSLPTPIYHHHELLYEESGKKISKRASPKSISSFRTNGYTPRQVIELAFSLRKK